MTEKIDSIEIYVDTSDRIAQINDIGEKELKSIWERFYSKYKDFTKFFCYHNTNAIPFKLLDEFGATLVDDCVEMRLSSDKLTYAKLHDIRLVTYGDYDDFASYHDEHNPDMAWTSERIKSDLSRWAIFTYDIERTIAGYLLLSMWNPVESEIFCVDSNNIEQCEALISYAAKYALDSGKKSVLFMADENSAGHKAALSIGFSTTGFYKGFKIGRISNDT